MTISLLLNVQSDLLGIIGQEAVAHAALIFASLTAAFAFATGFDDKVGDMWGKVIYVVFLGPIIGIAVYAVFRMYLWGTLLGVVLNNPKEFAFTKCPSVKPFPQVPIESQQLSLYWACVNKITSSTLSFNFITARTFPTSLISLGFGFVIATSLLILVMTPEERKPVKNRVCILSVLICLILFIVIVGVYSARSFEP